MTYTPALLMLITFLTVSFSGQAQTQSRETKLYRCGPEGRILQDSPCPAGTKASEATVRHDQPSDAQAREARERAKAEARSADAMQKARLKQEAEDRRRNVRPAGIDGRTAKPADEAASKPGKKKPKRSPEVAR